MKTALMIAYVFALPALLLVAAIVAAVGGDWGAAGICAFFALMLAGSKVLL